MGKTIAQKIFDSHLIESPFPNTYVLKLDRVFCHEITTPIAINDLMERKMDRVFDAGKINDSSSCLRITGKGDGRCTFAFMKKSDVETYRQKLVEYEKIFGFHPIEYEVETADGARAYFFEN